MKSDSAEEKKGMKMQTVFAITNFLEKKERKKKTLQQRVYC